MNDHEHVETLIVGATFAGIGVGACLGENGLIVERTMLPGHEFINSYQPGKGWNIERQQPLAEQLQQQWRSKGLLTKDGKVHLGGIAPTVHKLLLDSKQPIRLMNEIVEVCPDKSGGWRVTVFDASGIRTLTAGRIIDTTSDCRSAPGRYQAKAKFIGAALHRTNTEEAQKEIPQAWQHAIIPGAYDSEAYLQLPIDMGATWEQARYELFQSWSERPEELKPWTIAAIADAFTYHVSSGHKQIAEGWDWLPSCAYDNPLEAIEAGIRYYEERVVTSS
ncbi:hypothetical protein OB236_08290 [Paenibacillus sp. WQ 127069]|uniref:Uncharacterized protein n=1 Tax=Paenibacillus baimaensis TaxID=2982185 RepID=A0ABT2UBX3_9BACL|nr:hypothetical protein [Paenibacillus sp. WQ 127069]MCU6792123.1 hypothetical protein [Paenibacillus sp. WQ 127069]